MKYYLNALRLYADFSGRASRKEYWMFVLFNILFVLAAALLGGLCAQVVCPDNERATMNLITNFAQLYAVGIIIPSMAVAVRRLHDVRKSGWLMILLIFPVMANNFLPLSEIDPVLIIILRLLAFGGSIFLLVMMMLVGDEDANRYGEKSTVPTIRTAEQSIKNLALTLTIAGIMGIIVTFLTHIKWKYDVNIYVILKYVNPILFLTAGILLLQKRDRSLGVGILFMLAAVMIVNNMISLNGIGMYGLILFVVDITFVVAWLSAGVVWMQRNRKQKFIAAITPKFAAVCLIVAFVVAIVYCLYFFVSMPEYFPFQLFEYLYIFVLPVLAYTLTCKTSIEEPAQEEEKISIQL
ncbi:MAG: DUF805 domain-containing protein [Bacteroidales bacterium]|jgi:uncharacterized membrane protein YhaH (DUF805 family)|nr:DUF805 domain-containing protein [Bacteroidales bacterium]